MSIAGEKYIRAQRRVDGNLRPTAFLRVGEPGPVDLDPALHHVGVLMAEMVERGVAPAEGGAAVNADTCSARSDGKALGHAVRVLWPQERFLRVRHRRTREIAERAPASEASIALALAERAPTLDLLAGTARTADSSPEPAVTHCAEQNAKRRCVRMIEFHGANSAVRTGHIHGYVGRQQFPRTWVRGIAAEYLPRPRLESARWGRDLSQYHMHGRAEPVGPTLPSIANDSSVARTEATLPSATPSMSD